MCSDSALSRWVGIDWQYSDYSIYSFIEIIRIFIGILIERRNKVILDSIENYIYIYIYIEVDNNIFESIVEREKRINRKKYIFKTSAN